MVDIGEWFNQLINTVVIIIVVLALGLIGSLTNWFGFGSDEEGYNDQLIMIRTDKKLEPIETIVVNNTDTSYVYWIDGDQGEIEILEKDE